MVWGCGSSSAGGPGSGAGGGGSPSSSGGVASGGSGNPSGGNVGAGGSRSGAGGTATSGAGGAVGSGGAGGLDTAGRGGSAGGRPGTGGTVVLGTGGSGGAQGNRVRAILPFDQGWLFSKGDPAGAEQASFADTAWRAVNVPHDWSIEGSFSQTAATTGRGGYLPSGVAWYRKHFTLSQDLSGHDVFVEFDGVMANSDVYVNGTKLGHHPLGYVSFRYDMTPAVKLGTDNVIAVRTDTSTQPASRYYQGAGIYRHVRVIAAAPVHVAQWATYVTTPAVTSGAATVHVTTSVTNGGTGSASVSVQGVVSDPGGAALPAVTAPAQSIAAGASASFAFDVMVSNPKLWDLAGPNLYALRVNVLSGSSIVDDDVTTFGIRTLVFDPITGMSLNGKNIKFQGVAIHQELHALGVAAPQRAVQRRLAQLKLLGVNAIRTAHDPPSPDFLELTDRMGLLVLDEFTDVWTAHKYSDVGDYAANFNQAATAPTGMPPVPGIATGATWGQVDLTGFLMRDRNHPSVALYSLGNEMHESHATRVPILTKLMAISHAVDPARKDTEALLDPATAGDIDLNTNTVNYPVDVWGNNYDTKSAVAATKATPPMASILTESGTQTSNWTLITSTPALMGEFMWTGVDYLGEAPDGWPTVGASPGIMDAVGTPKTIGYTWQGIWGAPKTAPPATGTTATKVVLTPDHASIVTDGNDVSYVKATIADASGRVVTGSSAAVTFALTGPGTIVAVDSGSNVQESFRGNVRNAYQGIAFAIVQATGAGTITVTASAPGLTAGSATIQAAAGTFVPCSGGCD
ncbi:MAG TPA: glycoside hydrolase family 2 TIM barrel-domain containing protein [Polyangia bacterium]|nr:glycoside hydrolase family 2 TIM barrel-domain containing protein [Polyangia bacterium]